MNWSIFWMRRSTVNDVSAQNLTMIESKAARKRRPEATVSTTTTREVRKPATVGNAHWAYCAIEIASSCESETMSRYF